MSLSRILLGIALLSLYCFALDLEQMMIPNIKPSFDCAKAKFDDEFSICGDGFGAGYNMLPIIDNFYSSFYKIVSKETESKDNIILKNISTTMLKNRRKCPSQIHFHDTFNKEAFDKENEENLQKGYDVIDLHNLSSGMASVLGMNCYEYHYLKALRQITEFLYATPQYKIIFEKIFYPNPKEYYKLIMTKKISSPVSLFDEDADVILDVIDKAAKDNLLESNGALKQ